MSTPMIEEWYSILPSKLLNRAYQEPHGELAWPKWDAVQVVGLLQDKGYRVLGVDTWLPTRPGPSPLIRDWDERSPISAIDFIKTFELIPVERSNPELKPYFNFAMA